MPLLSIINLVKHFGGVKAVDQVSFNINKGDIIGLIGPNGAGKTTLFNLVCGSLKATSGEIFYNDMAIINCEPHIIAKLGISRTFQNIRLFKQLTVAENVFVGGIHQFNSGYIAGIFNTPQAKINTANLWKKVAETLEFTGLLDYADEMSDNLAYGLQRRVELARALVSDPQILMLDEPTAGMNSGETRNIMNLLKRFQSKDATILVIEHDMQMIMEVCNYIVVLNYGKIIADGSPDEVRNNEEVIKAYLGSDDYA